MMKMKKLLGVFFGLCLLGSVGSAQAAAMMWLEPTYQETSLGGTVSLTVHMDFTGGTTTLGGGFDIFFDAGKLAFDSFVFNPLFVCAGCPSDPGFSYLGNPGVGTLSSVGIGQFLGGITGSHTIGTITLKAIGVGLAALWMGDGSLPTGPLLDYTTGAPLSIAYGGAEVLVTPLPAAAWLMIAGLGFLVGFGRRKMGASV